MWELGDVFRGVIWWRSCSRVRLFFLAMADEDRADDGDDLLPLPALPSGRFLHDDDEFPDDENDVSPASPPAQKQRGRLRISNVGGSLTFLLQVGCSPFCRFPAVFLFVRVRALGIVVAFSELSVWDFLFVT